MRSTAQLESGNLEISAMLSELDAFGREWEAAERSRHTRLIEQLKREYREVPRVSAPIEAAIDVLYSVRLSQSVLRQPVKPQSRLPQAREERSP